MKKNIINSIFSVTLLSSCYLKAGNLPPELSGDTWKPSYDTEVLNIKTKVDNALNKSIKINHKKGNINIDINNDNINYKYNRTLELIGVNELNYFKEYFGLTTEKETILKIKSIQTILKIKSDGIIGQNTLKNIYLNYYSNNINDLPTDIKNRYRAYIDMINYKPRGYKNGILLYPNHIPNVFNKKYYYGELGSNNIQNTFIDSTLDFLPKNIENNGNIAYLKKINGKYVVLVYINGELRLASYTSPGNPYSKGAIKTPRGKFLSTWGSKYWISGAKEAKGAPMAYSVNIVNGVFVHAGKVNGERRSHGCVRLPLLYAKGLYDIFKKYGNINWHILDN